MNNAGFLSIESVRENQLANLSKQIDRLEEKVLTLENERDILKSKLSETKADIKYILENGESIYIRNKYIRGDKNEKTYN